MTDYWVSADSKMYKQLWDRSNPTYEVKKFSRVAVNGCIFHSASDRPNDSKSVIALRYSEDDEKDGACYALIRTLFYCSPWPEDPTFTGWYAAIYWFKGDCTGKDELELDLEKLAVWPLKFALPSNFVVIPKETSTVVVDLERQFV